LLWGNKKYIFGGKAIISQAPSGQDESTSHAAVKTREILKKQCSRVAKPATTGDKGRSSP